jgi:hypothetical protein
LQVALALRGVDLRPTSQLLAILSQRGENDKAGLTALHHEPLVSFYFYYWDI